jgi:hypothetical protein
MRFIDFRVLAYELVTLSLLPLCFSSSPQKSRKLSSFIQFFVLFFCTFCTSSLLFQACVVFVLVQFAAWFCRFCLPFWLMCLSKALSMWGPSDLQLGCLGFLHAPCMIQHRSHLSKYCVLLLMKTFKHVSYEITRN